MLVIAACCVLVRSPPLAPGYPDLALRLTRYELDARVDYDSERVSGTARLTLRNASSTPVLEVPLVSYRLMPISAAMDSAGDSLAFTQQVVAYEDEPKQQVNFARVVLRAPLPPGASTTIVVRYGGFLLGYVETGMLYVRDHVDTAFTILRDDALAFPRPAYPSYAVMRKAGLQQFDYDARITVPESLWVANGGRLRERHAAHGLATFAYENIKPAWRMDFAIARYQVLDRGALHVVYFPADSTGAIRVMDAAQRSMAAYRDWFGPLRDTSGFTVIEIPDGFGSQADVTSILQTAAAFQDPDARRQLYHEISHLWDVPPGEPDSPRLNEGLATFLEYYTADLLDSTTTLEPRLDVVLRWLRDIATRRSELRATPLKDYGRQQMTDFSYSVGMVLVAVLHELVGDAGFRRVIRACHVQQTGCRTLDDFVHIAEAVTPQRLTPLFGDWIYSTRWVDAVTASGSVRELVARYRMAGR